MKRLNGMDAMLLYSETPNLHTHTLKVAIVHAADYDGEFTFDVFRRTIARRLHLLAGRTGEGAPPFDPENLRALVPDVAERDVYVCGPPAMTTAVLTSLRALKVPPRQVHAERFGLA